MPWRREDVGNTWATIGWDAASRCCFSIWAHAHTHTHTHTRMHAHTHTHTFLPCIVQWPCTSTRCGGCMSAASRNAGQYTQWNLRVRFKCWHQHKTGEVSNTCMCLCVMCARMSLILSHSHSKHVVRMNSMGTDLHAHLRISLPITCVSRQPLMSFGYPSAVR